jgi:hypothetical protein
MFRLIDIGPLSMGVFLYKKTVEMPGTDISNYLAITSIPFCNQAFGSYFKVGWDSLFRRQCNQHYQLYGQPAHLEHKDVADLEQRLF